MCRRGGTAWLRACLGMACGVAVASLLGESYGPVITRAAEGFGAGAPVSDPQGALTLLPAFQVGLYLALWVAAFAKLGWTRFWSGLALLGVMQLATLTAVQLLAGHAGFIPHVRDVRAWAVAGPLLVVVVLEAYGCVRRRPSSVAAMSTDHVRA